MAADTSHMIVVTDLAAYVLNPSGASTLVGAPYTADVQFYPGVRPRFAVLRQYTALVNCVSQPIWFDPFAVPRAISLLPPATAPTVAAGGGSGLTGTYKVRVQFLVKDELGNLLAQSPLGPESLGVTLANQNLALTSVPLASQKTINARRIYRTLTNGATYFLWLDIDDNITTAVTDGAPDASLSIFAAPLSSDLGTAPARMTNITAWKGRLWGVPSNNPDRLVATAINDVSSWPLSFDVPPRADLLGISGFLPRRAELAVCKRGLMWKVIGDSASNFRVEKLKDGIGCTAPDSCQVIGDVGYFLGGPLGHITGVFAWDGTGVNSLTDASTQPWFTTDTYFNRKQFPNAVGGYNPVLQAYVLFLAAAGSNVLDRWIAWDLNAQHWMGPHKTDGLTPAGAFTGFDPSGDGILMVGGTDGNVYRADPAALNDGAGVAIDFHLFGKFHAGDPPAPDRTHVFLRPTILTKAGGAGTLSVTPHVGNLSAAAGPTQTVPLAQERTVLNRLGVGRLCQLEFQLANVGETIELYGYELPYADVGRR